MQIFSNTGGGIFIPAAISFCALLICYTVQAQEHAGSSVQDSVRSAYISYIEEITTELEADDADQLIDYVESLREVPIDINSATRSELGTLPFLNEHEIGRIIATREERGRYDTQSDLYSVDGIGRERVHLLLNFIYIGIPDIVRRRFIPQITLRSHFSSEIHERRGYRENHYLGSPLTTYQRVLIGLTPSIYGGLIIAKSAGERSLTERSSGYISLRFFRKKIHVTVGDYRLHLGQGLLLWSGFGIAKSGNPARGVIRRSAGVRPAASRSEHYRFRGGTVSFNLSSTEAIFFYGHTPRAATVYDDGSVRTLITYPVYRTETDREKRNALTETLFGAHLRQSFFRNITIGLTAYSLRYNREFKPDVLSRFAGERNDHGSIDWIVNYRNIALFGEAATRLPVRDIAIITGVTIPVAQGVDASFVYRSYPSEYISMYGFPFSERRGPADDEHGVYLGVRFRPAPRHLFEGYFDLYSFANDFRSPGLPVNGSDVLLRVEYPVGAATMFDTRARRRSRAIPVVESLDGINERTLADRIQNNVRINFITDPHRSFRLRLQYEKVFVSYSTFGDGETGSYVAADVRWNARSNLRINARYLLFGTESFDSRLYTSEYDMPGRVRTVLLNGQGAVLSFGAQYTPFDNFTISIKYNELFRSDGEFIGSGFQETDGSALGVVLMQIDARF